MHIFINGATWDFLSVTSPVTPTFYALPKIHKHPTVPPGRSGIDNITSRGSTIVDDFLKFMVQNLPSYLKDSMHLLQIFKNVKLPSNTLLVAIDVESLYSNIPHDKGTKIVKEFIEELEPNQRHCGSFILELLFFILTHNYFLFDGSH